MTGPRRTRESELIEQIRAIDVSAPESLHSAVDAMIAERSSRGGRRARRRRAGEEATDAPRARRSGAGAPTSAYGLRPRLAALGAIAAAVLAFAIVIGT